MNYLWHVYHSQPLQQLQLLLHSKLQMAKTVDKTSFVQIYNTCIPRVPAMSKHEYTTSAGKFVNGYTKQKSIVPISTICGQIYTVEYHLGYIQCMAIYGNFCLSPNLCVPPYTVQWKIFEGENFRKLLTSTTNECRENFHEIGTKIKRTNELCCHILRSCCVVLVKRLHFQFSYSSFLDS